MVLNGVETFLLFALIVALVSCLIYHMVQNKKLNEKNKRYVHYIRQLEVAYAQLQDWVAKNKIKSEK